MGGINSVCLKPRSITNSATSTRRPSSSADNEANIVTTDFKRRMSEAKTMATTMKNGDVVADEEIKGEKIRKKKKKNKQELSHAFHLNGFQSQDSIGQEASHISSLGTDCESTVDGTTSDIDEADRINVNTASAEELMTLAGVSRSQAENLIHHRRKIGGFKYLEDIAIVNGFGAAKLNTIKREIKLGSGNNSRNSSPRTQPSHDRLPKENLVSSSCSPSLLNFGASKLVKDARNEQTVLHSSPTKASPLPPFKPVKPSSSRDKYNHALAHQPYQFHRRSASGVSDSVITNKVNAPDPNIAPSLVDVNTATVFQLMTVPGLSQSIAQKIFMHRNRFGPFSSVGDVKRVKGFKASLLDDVSIYLMASPMDSSGGGSLNSLVSEVEVIGGGGGDSHKDDSGICDAACKLSSRIEQDDLSNVSSTASSAVLRHKNPTLAADQAKARAKTALSSRPLSTSIIDMYLPFVESTYRPTKDPAPCFRENKEVFRIGSWNLLNCGNEKATNVGATEVICMTILESGLGIVGFQDLRDVSVVEHICGQLNNPSLPVVKKWIGANGGGRAGEWKCCVSHARDRRLVGFIYDSSQKIKITQVHDYTCPLGGAIVSRATFRIGVAANNNNKKHQVLKAFSVINAHFYTQDPDKLLSAFSTLRDAMNETARATKNAPVVVISSVAAPRKSSYSWSILGLSSLLSHGSAQFAAGGQKPNEKDDDDEKESGESSNDSTSLIAAPKPLELKMSELIRYSASTPNSPKRHYGFEVNSGVGHGDSSAGVDDSHFSSSHQDSEQKAGFVTTSSLMAALESLAAKSSSSPQRKSVSPPEVNVFMDVKSSTLHTGHGQVVEDGLSSPWIPDEWALGGNVSNFRPVWAEFFKEFKSVEVLNRRSRFRASLPIGRSESGGGWRRATLVGFGRRKKKETVTGRPVSEIPAGFVGGFVPGELSAATAAARDASAATDAANTQLQRENKQSKGRTSKLLNVRSASSFFTMKGIRSKSNTISTTPTRHCDTQLVTSSAAGSPLACHRDTQLVTSSTAGSVSLQPLKLHSDENLTEFVARKPVLSSYLILNSDGQTQSLSDQSSSGFAQKPTVTNVSIEDAENAILCLSEGDGTPSEVAGKREDVSDENEDVANEDEELPGVCEILSKSVSSDNATFLTCNSDFSSAEED